MTKISKRWIWTVALAATLALAGCGGGSTTPSDSTAPGTTGTSTAP
jgi:hypothetical protein